MKDKVEKAALHALPPWSGVMIQQDETALNKTTVPHPQGTSARLLRPSRHGLTATAHNTSVFSLTAITQPPQV